MKRLCITLAICIIWASASGTALADHKESARKLSQALQNTTENDVLPKNVLSPAEANEFVDWAIKAYKQQGVELTREQAALYMGGVLGYMNGIDEGKKKTSGQTAPKQAPAQQGKSDLPEFDIAAYCKRVAQAAGGGYMIESGCIDMENDAKKALLKMQIPAETMAYCTRVARGSSSAYSILQGCIEMELDAKKQLGR